MRMRTRIAMLSVILILSMLFSACGDLTDVEGGTETVSATDSDTQTATESGLESTDGAATSDTSEVSSQSATETESSSQSETETESSSQSETETESETETKEETELITDVMIGETLDAEYAANFTVSRVFSDDMVVQRGEHIRVWGFADESENGKKVSGRFKGMFAEAIIEDGEWCLTFGARLEADTAPAEMKIYTDKKDVVFEGVLVGDVYMVIGQSNVEYSVQSHIDNTDPKTQGGGLDAIDPDSIIRLNMTNNSTGGTFPTSGSTEVCRDLTKAKQWTRTTVNDTLQFSALGYYFARHMVERGDNKVPVGVIEIGFSGAPIGCFVPNEVADKLKTDTYNAEKGVYTTTGVNAFVGSGRFIYNRHIAPFERYAIAGVVWLQGASNNAFDEAKKYNETFTALMEHMRGTHNLVNRDFPVLVSELPSIYRKPEGHTGTWHFMDLGTIRSYMGNIPMSLDNCYVAASGDVWADRTYFNSLHPNSKYEQADRLADIAEVLVLGEGDLPAATGPVLKSYKLSDDEKSMVLTFSNVGTGLKTTDGADEVKGIIVLLKEYPGFVYASPTSARITAKDQITVTYSENIKGVAYYAESEDLYGETLNLCNGEGRIASAFCTGFTDKDLSGFAYEDFSTVSKRASFIDMLRVDGDDYFDVGKVTGQLNEAGGKVTVKKGAGQLLISGWIGYKFEILMFGHSIDRANACLDSYPSAPGQAVIDAGGEYAERFFVYVDISELPVGEHTVDIVALLHYKKDVVTSFFSFDLVVTE